MRLTLFCEHSAYIEHLERELEWFKMQMVHERQRAEVAIDRLLHVEHIPPVTLPDPHVETEEDKAMRALLTDPEFTHAGGVE